MPAPAVYPIDIYIGDDYLLRARVKNRSTGAAVDITGRTYTAQLRRYPASPDVLAEFVCAIEDAAGGIFTCTLDAATTSALAAGTAAYDVQETVGIVVHTYLRGPAELIKDVTR
jgi:hypothetical protein